jgi:hypothetical protein
MVNIRFRIHFTNHFEEIPKLFSNVLFLIFFFRQGFSKL